MLTLNTDRHKLLINIPGISGCGAESASGLALSIDAATDRLHSLCLADAATTSALVSALTRAEGARIIARHLKEATPGAEWVRECAGPSMCRRVLYLMHPDRFGFAKYGWIH